MEGPPLPPGPPPPGHFDDRGGPGGGGHKRGRSPPRGGPPFDRDDRYDGRPPPRSPQRRRFNDGGRGPGRRFPGRRGGRRDDDEPLSFREFTIQHLPDHVAPAEAERAYQRYQETHAEKFRERNFHEIRNDPKLREAHDPRKLDGPFRARTELAVDAAKEFHERIAAGTLEMPPPADKEPPADAVDADKDDAADEGKKRPPFHRPERRDARGRFPVPPQAWNPTRLAHDLRNLVRLVKSLDDEKGVEAAWTESADVKAVLDAPDPTPQPGREPARKRQDDKGAADPGAADQGADMETDDAPAEEEVEGDGTGGVDQDALAEAVDARIVYLWRVHGVDYYARQELSVADYVASPPAGRVDADAGCLMRAAKPSDPAEWEDVKGEEGKDGDANDEDDAGDKTDGEKPDGEKPDGEKPDGEKPDGEKPADSSGKTPFIRRRRTAAETWAFHTDRWCVDRVTRGDPEEARLGRARADRDLNAWMDSCIVKHDENRYGCTLSAKLFVSPEYVLKHIKNKQGAAVDAQLDKIYDRIYMENYLAAAKKEDLAAKRQKRQEREERLRDGAGGRGGRSFDGGRGGRGGRGPRADRNQFQRPQISVMQAAPGMMLVPAEGAGPNGPYVQVPAPEGGGDAPEGGQQQVVVVAEGKGGKRYQDIDAPKSNRVVLDYGDI